MKRKKKSVPKVSVPEKSLFAINKFKLDEEWVKQPSVMFDFAIDMLPKAEQEYEEIKAAKEVLYADLDEDIRKDPEEYGFSADETLRETAIKSCISRNKEHKRLSRRLIEAGYAVSILKGAVKTLEHRKAALESLTGLDARGYFSRPKSKG